MGAGRLAATLATTAAALACVPVSGAAYSTHAALKGVCVVAAAWVAAWRSARFRGATTFELLLASVLALGLASAFGSHDGYAAALALAPLLAWLLIARGVRHSPEVGLDTVAALLTGSSAIVCGLALAEALGARLPWSVIARPGSTLGGRNYVAEYLVIALPLVVWHVSAKPTVGRVLTAGAMATVVCVARCRGAWLAFALSTLVVLLLGGRGLAHRAVVVAMLCGIIAGASAPWPGLRFTSDVASTAARLLEHKTGSGRVRLEQHRLGVTIVSRAPLLGVGPGGFEDAASEHAHRVGRRPHPVRAAATPNSDWVRIGVEHGLLGLLLFGAALSTLVLGSLRAPGRRRTAASSLGGSSGPGGSHRIRGGARIGRMKRGQNVQQATGNTNWDCGAIPCQAAIGLQPSPRRTHKRSNPFGILSPTGGHHNQWCREPPALVASLDTLALTGHVSRSAPVP